MARPVVLLVAESGVASALGALAAPRSAYMVILLPARLRLARGGRRCQYGNSEHGTGLLRKALSPSLTATMLRFPVCPRLALSASTFLRKKEGGFFHRTGPNWCTLRASASGSSGALLKALPQRGRRAKNKSLPSSTYH